MSALDLSFAAGRRYAVLGLARSGLAAARELNRAGAEVLAWDDGANARAKAEAAGLAPRPLDGIDWTGIEALVLSPGIPHSHPRPHPAAAAARAAGRPIIGDIELLALAERRSRFLGITGTNGKSTTTALTGHILQHAGRKVAVGGNIGRAVLDLPALGEGGIYVLELSSYQLELLATLALDVAVLLNITPDHLDRHGGFTGYVAAKKLVFARQSPRQLAVIGLDDETCRAMAADLQAEGRRVWPISAEGVAKGGIYVAGSWLIDDTGGKAERLLDLATLDRLPGRHNWQNIAAAYAGCRGLGLDCREILAALPAFPGLEHRQEFIAEIDGVRFVNDSKATNAEATAKALVCYRPIYWILGGRAKETGLQGLEDLYGGVAEAFLIGEASERFERELRGAMPSQRCGTMERAVNAAFAAAKRDGRKGAVVLLSPAAASFDQYDDFEERGRDFRRIVEALEAAR